MSRAPAVSAALRSAGLHDAARTLDKARDAVEEVTALRLALATIDGAQFVLRCYARSLRNTQALADRAALRIVEERITEHLGTLMRRASATGIAAAETVAGTMARNVQGGEP